MKVRVLHPTIIDSQWLQIDDVVEVENETAQPYVETGLIEVIDDVEINPPNTKTGGEENPPDVNPNPPDVNPNPPDVNPNPPNEDNDDDENPPDEDGGKGSNSGKGK